MALSGGLWTRKCTCAVETESDSDADSSDGDQQQQLDPASPERDSSSAPQPYDATLSAALTLARSLNLTGDARSLPPRRKLSGVRDPIQTSHALHNSEALRQAQSLANVFCACYETETVLSLVQKRERTLSPVQLMLLEPENMAQVFIYATHFLTATHSSSRQLHHHHTSHHRSHRSSHGPQKQQQQHGLKQSPSAAAPQMNSPSSLHPLADPAKYRRPFVATEIIVRFYLHVITWQGSPKQLPSTSPVRMSSDTNGHYHHTTPAAVASADKSSPSPVKPFLLGLAGSLRRGISRGASSSNSNSTNSSSRVSDASDAAAAVRGYVLHIDDLTLVEWTRIFTGLYRVLWEHDGHDLEVTTATTSDAALDSVLLANMCRITKNFVVFPSVHAMLHHMLAPRGDVLFAHFAQFTYNPEVATLVHGLVHLARSRAFAFDPIVESLVAQLVQVPPELPPASAASSTSQFNVRRPLIHARISGCADILVKLLTQQFPNTFSYYIQAKRQLASFESVEAFERELFPPKIAPNDHLIHAPLQSSVLSALLTHVEIATRVAEVAVAEVRFLDANYRDGASIPTTLVLDVLKSALDVCETDASQLVRLVAPVQRMIETLCAAINYHEHISTISEFASRDCFSDSDSEDDDVNDDSDVDGDDGDSEHTEEDTGGKRDTTAHSDALQNLTAPPLRVQPLVATATTTQATDWTRRHLQLSLLEPPATCISSTSGQRVVNHRPLASTLLVVHVLELFDAVVRMRMERIDAQLARFGLAQSLLDVFEHFPRANILHCRVVTLLLHVIDRVAAPTGGRRMMHNPLLRSVFKPPTSLLAFILEKLRGSATTHAFDAHLRVLGVKIDKVCAAPRLDQELVRQYCNATPGWMEWSSTLIAAHYQQIDALDDAVLGTSALVNGTLAHRLAGSNSNNINNISPRRRNADSSDDVFPLARPSSSATGFLSQELEPFRRLPVEQEGFGSRENRASGADAVHPTDMFRSRAQSQYPQSILDVLKRDTSPSSLDVVEDDDRITGDVYEKRSQWVKVHLEFDKASCVLTLTDIVVPLSSSPSMTSSTSQSSSNTNDTATSSTSASASPAKRKLNSTAKLKQFLRATTQQWTAPHRRSKKLVVCNARKWIAFGRSIKDPDVGAFGFQVDAFDRSREVDETLTFVTRADATRTRWFDGLTHAMTTSQALHRRSSLTSYDTDADAAADVADREARVLLVQCVAMEREQHAMRYHVVPNVHLLGPVVSSTFFLKSDVPDELPFWGTFHGVHGIAQYAALLRHCVRVCAVVEKSTFASGYSVIVEFDATLERVDDTATNHGLLEQKMPAVASASASRSDATTTAATATSSTVTVSWTDTYLISGHEIVGLTRTIADSEKLLVLLCDDV